MTSADWYFDFVSPFPYFQLEQLGPAQDALELRPKPVLFAALLDHWGNKGPGEIASKRTFVYRHVQWIADRQGIALRFPPRHPFNPLRALRLAIALGSDLEAIRAIYRFIWAEGGEVDTEEGWAALCERLGVVDAEARIAAPEVKQRLRANGEEAIAAGVFGVPTLVIEGQLFWGSDATEMARDYLRDRQLFDTPEMRRIEALPIGASRAR